MKNELITGVTTIAGASLGTITVATVPVTVTTAVPAAGIAGWLGFTTTVTSVVTAPITLPVGGVIAAGALLTYGGYTLYNRMKDKEA